MLAKKEEAWPRGLDYGMKKKSTKDEVPFLQSRHSVDAVLVIVI